MNIRNLMNIKNMNLINELLLLSIFIIIGTIGRTILVGLSLQPFPNFEIIMVLTFLAALIIRPAFAFLVPLASMIISDILLGNPIFTGSHMNKIVIFTYTGFLLISLISTFTKKQSSAKLQQLKLKNIAFTMGMGIGFVLIYDIWTNVGWWYIISSNLTLGTLVNTFMLGIPFMLYHMLSATLTFTLIALPTIYYMTNKKHIELPKAHSFKQHIPLIAVTLFFIILSIV